MKSGLVETSPFPTLRRTPQWCLSLSKREVATLRAARDICDEARQRITDQYGDDHPDADQWASCWAWLEQIVDEQKDSP